MSSLFLLLAGLVVDRELEGVDLPAVIRLAQPLRPAESDVADDRSGAVAVDPHVLHAKQVATDHKRQVLRECRLGIPLDAAPNAHRLASAHVTTAPRRLAASDSGQRTADRIDVSACGIFEKGHDAVAHLLAVGLRFLIGSAPKEEQACTDADWYEPIEAAPTTHGTAHLTELATRAHTHGLPCAPMRVEHELTPTLGGTPGNARPSVRDEPGNPGVVRAAEPEVLDNRPPLLGSSCCGTESVGQRAESEPRIRYTIVKAGRPWTPRGRGRDQTS
jgi:hypothetical protein